MVNRQDDTNNTLSRLNQALNSLEGRLSAAKQQVGRGRNDAPSGGPGDISMIRARQAALTSTTQQAGRDHPLHNSAPRNSAITADELRAELHKIRAEMEREMSGNFTSGFETLRDDLHGLKTSVANSGGNSEGSNAAAQLRSDIASLKEDIAQLARQDTLDELLERWSVVEREVANLPQTVGSREDLMQMASRLENLQTALNSMPQTNDLLAMEEQVRMLAVAIERIAENSGSQSFPFDAIDTRFDEISRAVAAIPAASQVPHGMDPDALERIEARIARLAKLIEDSDAQFNPHSFDEQFAEIASRLNVLQEETSGLRQETRSSLPQSSIEALEAQIAQLSSRIGSGFDGPGARDEDVTAVNELGDRLNYIIEQINHTASEQQEASRSLVSSLDGRMSELASRIEANERNGGAVPTLDHMAGRLEEIAEMLASGGGNQPSASIANLEAQIAELTKSLNNGVSSIDEESLLAAARLAAEEAVARAGEGGAGAETLHHLTDDLKMLEALARDSDDRNNRTFEAIHDTLLKVVDHLAGLEDTIKLAPGTQARSQRVELHDAPPLQPDDMPEENVAFGQRENEISGDEYEFAAEPATADKKVSPAAAAAAAAAMAAIKEGNAPRVSLDGDGPAGETPAQSKSLLKGMAKRLRRGAKTPAPAVHAENATGVSAEEDFAAEAGVAVSDEPIEPGAGGADLSAIMRRVREERGGPAQYDNAPSSVSDDADNGKSDFIAAARRAARAAAADATVGSRSEKTQTTAGKSSLGAKLASRRKPILMGAGAILLALLAFPLIKGFVAPVDTMEIQNVQTQIEEPGEEDAMAAQDESAETDSIEENTAEAAIAEDSQDVINLEEPPVRDVTNQASAGADVLNESAEDEDMDIAGVEAPEMDAAAATAAEAADQADQSEQIEPALDDITLADIPEDVGPAALREAAVNGDAKALYLVGDYYFGGVVGQSGNDLEKALEWYERSAEFGYAPAQYRAGNFYEKGFGGERDLTKAKTWYQMAAAQGNAAAMHNLAVLFANGPDGTPDFASATRWFQKAAELGVKDSQFNLGILSAQGNGMEQNLAESYKWFAVAAKTGDQDAAAKRDEVAEALRPEQLEMAKGAVELWKQKEPVEEANMINVPDEWRTDEAQTAATEPELSGQEMKKAVTNIQAILNNNGYDAGPVDGVMGAKTTDAIRAFQEANGLKASGEVDQQLVAKLLEVAEKS